MSGPALRDSQSHHAIHESAWNEAEEALHVARGARAASDEAVFAQVAEVFTEIVETRILAHAGEEERGLYREWLAAAPGRQSTIDALRAEHDALRGLTAAIGGAMVRREYDLALQRMGELLQASADHSRHEEDVLRALSPKGWRQSEHAAALDLP